MKAVQTLAIALPPVPGTSRTSTTLVGTISSDGRIRVFDLAAVPADALAEPAQIAALVDYDTKGSRLTCMTMADGDDAAAVNGKRKRAVDDEEEDAESAGEVEGDESEEESEGEQEDEDEDEEEEEDEVEEE